MKKYLFLAALALAIFSAAGAGAQFYNNYAGCTYHAYRDCAGDSVYWFSSCGNQQELVQICPASGQVCKYGQCVFAPVPAPSSYPNPGPYPAPAPAPSPYIKHNKIKCYSSNLYWHDSRGAINDLYKSCADENTCTEDACSSGKCQNTLKCDGSTCSAGSADYIKYCGPKLSIIFSAKKDPNASSWDKSAEIGQNGNIYFMAVLKNNSDADMSNVAVSASIPQEVALLGNLKIDGTQTPGDIVSGVTIPSLPANSSKTITFDGKTQSFSATGAKQATMNATISGAQAQSDSVTLDLNPSQQPAAASKAPAANAFVEFLKRWYLWIIAAIVLVALFIIIFRRLSAE